jgi:hypothetical protein
MAALHTVFLPLYLYRMSERVVLEMEASGGAFRMPCALDVIVLTDTFV